MDAIVLVAFMALLALVATLLVRAMMAGETQEVPRALQCPVHGGPAEVVLVRDVRTGRLTAVTHCSRRSPPTACSAECARLLEAGADLRPRDPDPRAS